MKKIGSQISVALVCCLLGFMLAYQFKILSRQEKGISSVKDNIDVTAEIGQLQKQKDDLEKQTNDLQDKVKAYESAAVGNQQISKDIKKELDDSRTIIGNIDVQGQGIILYLVPKNIAFDANSNSSYKLTEKDLVDVVNELNWDGAEAISINDIRVTIRTGIKRVNDYILVNDVKIDPNSKITIKAIGDKKKMFAGVNFPGVFDDLKAVSDIKFETSDNIKINKYNKAYKFEYAKPVVK